MLGAELPYALSLWNATCNRRDAGIAAGERCAHCESTKSHTQTCWQMNKIIKKVTAHTRHTAAFRQSEREWDSRPLFLSLYILSAKWKYPLLAKTRACLMEMCVCGDLVCRIVCRYTRAQEKSRGWEGENAESRACNNFALLALSASALIQFSATRSAQVTR